MISRLFLFLWMAFFPMAIAIALTPFMALLPLLGWRNHPGYARRFDRMGKPGWLPNPSAEARVKLKEKEI